MNPISEVYNCDCLEYMRTLPDNHFDLCIADPPYGIGKVEQKSNGIKIYQARRYLRRYLESAKSK